MFVSPGRFERYLDFSSYCQQLYSLSASNSEDAIRSHLISMRRDYFSCPASERIAIMSQVALKRLADHLRSLEEDPGRERPNLELTRPVYEEAYRKLQMKHDLWKKNYKPEISLNALLCLLS